MRRGLRLSVTAGVEPARDGKPRLTKPSRLAGSAVWAQISRVVTDGRVPYTPRTGTHSRFDLRFGAISCRGVIKAEVPGVPGRALGAPDRSRPVRPRRTSKSCCAAAR